MPAISVIIPAYKARQFLPDCLHSIAKQTLRPVEVIVVDDASPEPVDDIVENFRDTNDYPTIRLIKHATNRGQAAGRNTGMIESMGDWIAFIDCDDIWAPNHLESLFNRAVTDDADFVFCPAILFDENSEDPDNFILGPRNYEEMGFNPLALLRRCFIITSSTMVRSTTMKSVDGFDENPDIRGVEDLDFFMRLLKKKTRFGMSANATLFYRKHSSSATGTLGYLSRQDVRVKEAHIRWPLGTAREKQIIMAESYMRAAINLWRTNADDRMAWVMKAVYQSWRHPVVAAKAIARTFRENRGSKTKKGKNQTTTRLLSGHK